MIVIQTLPTGMLSVNSYIVSREATDCDCFVVDPGGAAPIMEYLKNYNLNCTHILITHGHFDHVGGLAELQRATGAKAYIHRAEEDAMGDNKANLAVFAGTEVEPCTDYALTDDGMTIAAADFDVKVLATPGHSPGSVCFVIEDERVIFTGDLIFRLSIGRTDLWRSVKTDLEHSIINKLYTLPGDYRLLPGHMRESTLDFERQYNPFTKNMPL